MIRPSEVKSTTGKAPPYAETVYQLLAGARDAGSRKEIGSAVARAWSAWKGNPDAGFRSILRAAGAFAQDNDGYLFRYWKRGTTEEAEPLPGWTHLLVFPVPVESRMRVAYSYAQGLFLKYLYKEHGAIPREVREGWAEVIAPSGLPGADELWTGFLGSGVAEAAIAVSARGWISGYGRGRQNVDDTFLSAAYLSNVTETIVRADEQRRFHPQVWTMPGFRREDLEELADREYLGFNDPEVDEFRKRNKNKEWSTLRVYKWLEERSKAVPEFEDLVEDTISMISDASTRKDVPLVAAARRLEDLLRTEFVPLVSNQAYTDLAVPDLTRYLLLWALVERLPEDRIKGISFLGWDLSYLRALKEFFETPELRGSLKFVNKNKPGRGSKLLARLTGFDKLKAEVRLLPEGAGPSISAPFEVWSIEESGANGDSTVESGGKVCTVCGKSGELSEAGILPESKKRHYDNPQANRPADVCARCVQVWSIAPINTADEGYAVVEVPVESFLELFALYESLEGLNRLETLKTLNRVASLSVFPNRYLLLSRSLGRGRMPQVAQYYLQLARQPHFVRNLRSSLEVLAAQDRAELSREVALILSLLRLPSHYATSNDDKVPAMSIVNALERGRPYEALYVAAAKAHKDGKRDAQTISGGVAAYDKQIGKFGEFFVGRHEGAIVRKEIFEDVREFSDYLDGILRPLVNMEAREGTASVSGIARKYTEDLATNFAENGVQKFMYQVSSFVESRERKSKGKEAWLKIESRKAIYALDSHEKPEPGTPTALEQKFLFYQSKYADDKHTWKRFLREVEMRLLSLLLLNIQNQNRG